MSKRKTSSREETPLPTVDLSRFRAALRKWYASHARDLPWRRTRDPYPIWISEIMLQQTTVVAVVPYFARFLTRFPTLADLAAAEEAEVLRLWEGLGYYSRARNIHRTAQRLVAEQGGEFPRSVEQLHALPGIGRYTAGAIASFAFDLPAPIVEANTLRLYARLMGDRTDPRSTLGQERQWAFAMQLVPKRGAGQINQALMELGATVCTPVNPACDRCPLTRYCIAFATGSQAEIPPPKVRPEITAVREATVAICRGETYLLYRRPAGERWAGLWDFPRFGETPQELAEQVRASFGLNIKLGSQLTVLRHGVTRYRITLTCWAADYLSGEIKAGVEARWVPPDQFADYPLSKTGRRLANHLVQALTAPPPRTLPFTP